MLTQFMHVLLINYNFIRNPFFLTIIMYILGLQDIYFLYSFVTLLLFSQSFETAHVNFNYFISYFIFFNYFIFCILYLYIFLYINISRNYRSSEMLF